MAIKCPAQPPFPEGWYAAIVLDVIQHKDKKSIAKSNGNPKRRHNFTLQVEWDGGGVEEIQNPEWRMKGDEPDKQGRISHRDAKVNLIINF